MLHWILGLFSHGLRQERKKQRMLIKFQIKYKRNTSKAFLRSETYLGGITA